MSNFKCIEPDVVYENYLRVSVWRHTAGLCTAGPTALHGTTREPVGSAAPPRTRPSGRGIVVGPSGHVEPMHKPGLATAVMSRHRQNRLAKLALCVAMSVQ